MTETKTRSLVKALSWRIIATVVTSTLVYLFTGKADFAAKVGIADTTLKLGLYFMHERLWNKIAVGKKAPPPEYNI